MRNSLSTWYAILLAAWLSAVSVRADAETRPADKAEKQKARLRADMLETTDWLAANLGNLKPEALTGDLSGFYKFRVGDYRILYEILRDEQAIVIHMIGHRREIYRRQ